jgi:hypothetical protein
MFMAGKVLSPKFYAKGRPDLPIGGYGVAPECSEPRREEAGERREGFPRAGAALFKITA